MRTGRKGLLTGEAVLTLAGFALAALAAFLPWYAVIGGHGLGIRNDGSLRLSGNDHASDLRGTPGIDRLRHEASAAIPSLDPMTTAAIPELKPMREPHANVAGDDPDQPFPPRPFHLVHVAGGQALIADSQSLYLVSIGSELPDGSRIDRIDRAKDGFSIVTSHGDVLTADAR
ncbi:hypothetical protein [Pararhizobium mangrovi]|nr:hypothetical protein [Pararhizobium mangrovi]